MSSRCQPPGEQVPSARRTTNHTCATTLGDWQVAHLNSWRIREGGVSEHSYRGGALQGAWQLRAVD